MVQQPCNEATAAADKDEVMFSSDVFFAVALSWASLGAVAAPLSWRPGMNRSCASTMCKATTKASTDLMLCVTAEDSSNPEEGPRIRNGLSQTGNKMMLWRLHYKASQG